MQIKQRQWADRLLNSKLESILQLSVLYKIHVQRTSLLHVSRIPVIMNELSWSRLVCFKRALLVNALVMFTV